MLLAAATAKTRTMDAKILHSLATSPPTLAVEKSSTTVRYQIFSAHIPRRPLKITPIFSKTTTSDGTDPDSISNSAPRPQEATPPENVEIRFRRRSRRRSRKQRDDSDGDGRVMKAKTAASAAAPVKKKWEEMSVSEKAIELYVGEKGMLFWLNKFAYASIFIVIGAWILFRFVGPSLNLYQLDSAPLPPSSLFKGS